MDLLEIAHAELIACVAREISLRRRVYPRWVEMGRMRREKAGREIELMEAALRHLENCR